MYRHGYQVLIGVKAPSAREEVLQRRLGDLLLRAILVVFMSVPPRLVACFADLGRSHHEVAWTTRRSGTYLDLDPEVTTSQPHTILTNECTACDASVSQLGTCGIL